MGYLINPISFRLGNYRYWSSRWVIASQNQNTNYYYLLHQDLIVKRYIDVFFRKYYRNNNLELMYDHIEILRYNKKLCFILHIYDFQSLKELEAFYVEVLNQYKKYFNKNVLRLVKSSKVKNFNKKNLLKIFNLYHAIKKLEMLKFHYLYYRLLIHYLKCSVCYLAKGININNIDFKIKFLNDNIISAQFIANYIVKKVRYSKLNLVYVLNFIIRNTRLLQISGIKIQCAGRVSRRQRASLIKVSHGSIHYSSLSKNVDYGKSVLRTRHGVGGIKVWIYRPDLNNLDIKNSKRITLT